MDRAPSGLKAMHSALILIYDLVYLNPDQRYIPQDGDNNDDIVATPADSAGLTPMRSPAAACTSLLSVMIFYDFWK
jgi:hypothetical protein